MAKQKPRASLPGLLPWQLNSTLRYALTSTQPYGSASTFGCAVFGRRGQVVGLRPQKPRLSHADKYRPMLREVVMPASCKHS